MKRYRLFARDLSDKRSRGEAERFQTWLDASPEDEALYRKTLDFCEAAESVRPPEMPDPEREWLTVRRHIHGDAEEHVPDARQLKWNRFIGPFRFRYGWAFILTCAFLVSVGILWKVPTSESHIKKLTSEHGQRVETTFGDGSLVRLNSGSTVKYPERFRNNRREVYLSGEGFFDIVTDKRPFVVITNNARTTVLGTQFNVWARDKRTRVIVKEGRVRLQAIHSREIVVDIGKGEMSEISGDCSPRAPQPIDVDHRLGWLEGRLTFSQTSLMEVIAELERYYSVHVKLENQALKDATMTGSFEGMPIDTVRDASLKGLDRPLCVRKGIPERQARLPYLVPI